MTNTPKNLEENLNFLNTKIEDLKNIFSNTKLLNILSKVQSMSKPKTKKWLFRKDLVIEIFEQDLEIYKDCSVTLKYDDKGEYYHSTYVINEVYNPYIYENVYEVVYYHFSELFMKLCFSTNFFESDFDTLKHVYMLENEIQELETPKDEKKYLDLLIKPYRQEVRVSLYSMAINILNLEEEIKNISKSLKKIKNKDHNENGLGLYVEKEKILESLRLQLEEQKTTYDCMLKEGIEKLLSPQGFNSLEEFLSIKANDRNIALKEKKNLIKMLISVAVETKLFLVVNNS